MVRQCFGRMKSAVLAKQLAGFFERCVRQPVNAHLQPGEEPLTLSLQQAGIGSVVWCIGFAPDFGWLDAPVFNGRGQPQHERGVTALPGLYFLGLPWLHTWGSGRFSGVARDAQHLAEVIAGELPRASGGPMSIGPDRIERTRRSELESVF